MKISRWSGLLVAVLLTLTQALPAGADGLDVGEIYAPYQQLLDRYLEVHYLPGGGLLSSFDYRTALDDPATASLLERQNRILAEFDPARLETRANALAFWINAYNYFMIAWILENPQDGELVGSVRDYGSLVDPYDLFRRRLFEVGGVMHSLSGIELDILLGEGFRQRGWWDARVHFMVNCASVGCPPLRRTVYSGDNVERFMRENTRRALDTPLHLERRGDILRLTSLFDWYGGDFVRHSGSVEDFIRDNGSAKAIASLAATSRREFIVYDWALNSRENFRPLLEQLGR